MAANSSFQLSGGYNDKPPSSTGSGDADLASDPASSGFFSNDFKRHDDLKTMLDGNRDSHKLEAMKRIIGMVAKGKDASELFPAVVKNVVSKNLEVKKLVYVYLTRYAEEQQDVALLSISTFQRALKDPNQLIRASALRVLSSIRVPMISPIMMLAIKEAVVDMSPYVRKTAAHAIPKLYSLDPENKEQLIEVIEKLLADKTTLVVGSAIQAFEEVCPERIDLIHKNFRKLCNLLVDVEEWGQVVIVNMLTRYVRTQFVSPNQGESTEEVKAFYEDSEKEEEDEEEENENEGESKSKPYVMDPDHRLLLRQAKPLLNSRNASVVMSVAQLYHHCAPKAEVGAVAKALIRLLRSHKEVQYIVLSNIATMTINRKGMFEPFLKSFYIRSSDPTHIKLHKLEILTNLATETNISTILRELQTYVTSNDKDFAAATIQAIGRCASNIAEITDTCLNGLVHLMSNRDESVVAESVVVIKKLLQMQPTEHKDIIIHMAKMVDNITVPMARASILWLIGEYSERVPKIAPDVLRKMAKSFIEEEDIVKLQILNLSAKLCITNAKQTKLLCQYVFNLAKYDQNYDIRDRSRFLRQLILPGEKGGALAKYAKKIFLHTKPAPVLESKFKDRDQFQLGTLSHILNTRATGYQELPEWPEDAPDPSVRNIEVPTPWETKFPSKKKKPEKEKKSFYSDSEESSSEDDDSDEDDSSNEDDDEEEDEDNIEEDSSDEEDEDSSEEEDSSDEEVVTPVKKVSKSQKKVLSDEDEDETEDSSEEESSEEDSDDSDKKPPPKPKKNQAKSAPVKKTKAEPAKPSHDLLLDLDDFGPPGGGFASSTGTPAGDLLTPSLAGSMSNMSLGSASMSASNSMNFNPSSIPSKVYELVNRMAGKGLTISYKFTRTVSIFSPKMVSIEMTFVNTSDNTISGIKIDNKKLQPGMEIHDFPEIASLGQGASTSVLLAINFNDTTQPAKFDICTQDTKFAASITAPVGELLLPHTMSESEFLQQQGKLGGMHENSGNVKLAPSKSDPKSICICVHTVANVLQVPSSNENLFIFAARTLATGTLTLISVRTKDETAKLTVNCEKMVIGTMLHKEIKNLLSKS
ncbi:AP-3 complex subunit beta-2-like isoform X3 [Mizuhopecten yessoensis]|uniref:AP-3 complex subunit beta n=1 Tax=Mizuhopecten yessoensis TaxID=6573 RepID=A0A210QFK3_MIZYE|nr:AP-3 complex subunit beta-2-like isoform X3 [Mizuhopecten yessoensis]OWF47522.1 AP-3 complex subunit beta-2 [Mizuhopecten yessoensis]